MKVLRSFETSGRIQISHLIRTSVLMIYIGTAYLSGPAACSLQPPTLNPENPKIYSRQPICYFKFHRTLTIKKAVHFPKFHYYSLRHCATSRMVAGTIPDGVIGIFQRHNPFGRTRALGSTQPLTEMSTRNISWG